MAETRKFQPKGITPLPWSQWIINESTQVWGTAFVIYDADGKMAYRATINVPDDATEANLTEARNSARYLVHCANQYPEAITQLREIVELAKECCPTMSNRLHDAIVKTEKSVLSQAMEMEEKS